MSKSTSERRRLPAISVMPGMVISYLAQGLRVTEVKTKISNNRAAVHIYGILPGQSGVFLFTQRSVRADYPVMQTGYWS